MNSVKIRESLIRMIPADGCKPWPVYEAIVDVIMKYYFFSGVNYDYPEAVATFDRFLKTDVLQF